MELIREKRMTNEKKANMFWLGLVCCADEV